METMTVKELKQAKRTLTMDIKAQREFINELKESMIRQCKNGETFFWYLGTRYSVGVIAREERELARMEVERIELDTVSPLIEMKPVAKPEPKPVAPRSAKGLLESLDIEEMSGIISKHVGKLVNFVQYLNGNDRDCRLNVESNNLKMHSGIMEPLYSYLRISGSGHVLFSDDGDVFCIHLNYEFEYRSGSSNGTSLCTVWYRFSTNEWVIRGTDNEITTIKSQSK